MFLNFALFIRKPADVVKPTVSREVDAFMTDYLDNYRGGCASQRVAEELKRLAISAR